MHHKEKKLYLYNTLTEKKEEFIPLNESMVSFYACGPTVYNRAHLGNARSTVVYDVLFRVLRKIYTAQNVVYARNITDIDDKIINQALLENCSAKQIADKYYQLFEQDMNFLNCLEPNLQPKATEYIEVIIELIDRLIENGCAYKGQNGDIFFSVVKYAQYGQLSKRNIDQQILGARINKNDNKDHAEDFVLWKSIDPKNNSECSDIVDAIYDGGKYGPGRPGWHIECSAMTWKNFGETFDIHGGGADLKFPHHENEIAQVCAAFKDAKYARYWVHNGFLMVDGQKMSKSLNNFITMSEVVKNGFSGELVRYIFLMVNYNQPLNWSERLIENARNNLLKLSKALKILTYDLQTGHCELHDELAQQKDNLDEELFEFLLDNLNTSSLLLKIQHIAKEILDQSVNLHLKQAMARRLFFALEFLGVNTKNLLKIKTFDYNIVLIEKLIQARKQAKQNKDYEGADRIRSDAMNTMKIRLIDRSDGTTIWEPLED